MVFEVASIEIKEGSSGAFESGVSKALPLFLRAKGCQSVRLERSIETPLRYRLIIGWDTIEDHVDGFRNSADFQVWRTLVGDTFLSPPTVEHTVVVLGT